LRERKRRLEGEKAEEIDGEKAEEIEGEKVEEIEGEKVEETEGEKVEEIEGEKARGLGEILIEKSPHTNVCFIPLFFISLLRPSAGLIREFN
jgi:hypothetical protein